MKAWLGFIYEAKRKKWGNDIFGDVMRMVDDRKKDWSGSTLLSQPGSYCCCYYGTQTTRKEDRKGGKNGWKNIWKAGDTTFENLEVEL